MSRLTKAMAFAAVAVASGAAAGGSAFADIGYQLSPNDAGECRLSRAGAPPRTVGSGEEIMVFREDGRAW